jgi:hypothetical protein
MGFGGSMGAKMTATATTKLEVRDILARLQEVADENAAGTAAVVIGLTVANLLIDQLPTLTQSGTNLLAGLISLAGQYYLTTNALELLDARPVVRPRFGALWGMGIVSGLGIVLGLVLLILPGLYLMVRWAIAAPVMIAEDLKVNAALGRSWQLTRPNAGPILGAMLVIFVPAIVIGGSALLLTEGQPLLAMAIPYLCLFSALALSWLAAVAIYSLVMPTHADLVEVFA